MIDNHVGRGLSQQFVMRRLGVDHNKAVKAGAIYSGDMNQFDAQQANHGQVIRSIDLIDACDGDAGNLTPEQPFDRHGAGDRIGIGIDDDQDLIVIGELAIKASQIF